MVVGERTVDDSGAEHESKAIPTAIVAVTTRAFRTDPPALVLAQDRLKAEGLLKGHSAARPVKKAHCARALVT